MARLAVALAFALMACAPTFRTHGYAPTEDDLGLIVPGIDTRATVETSIGRPSTTGIVDESGWYYVSSLVRSYAYNPPTEVERTVVAIGFDSDGVVESVDRFGLEEGRVVNLSTRITPTGGRRLSIIRQLFSSLGRIAPINTEDR